MDIVYISELGIETVVGVYDWEKQIKQRVVLSVEMATDIRQAASLDDLKFAIDYKAVSDRLVQHITTHQFQLIETIAEQSADIILREFPVCWLRLSVSKPSALLHASNVGVRIERGEKSHG